MKLVITLALILFAGCYYQHPKSQYRPLDMSQVQIGMTEKEVRGLLGTPVDVIGSRRYDDGSTVRVIQYMEVDFGWVVPYDTVQKNYYLYFIDDRLDKWGRPGDWQREADQIHEIRFGPKNNILN